MFQKVIATMNGAVQQFLDLWRSLPLGKKISMFFLLVIVIAGFVAMFFLANQEDYQVLFNNLSPEDGGTIVSKLKEKQIPFKVEANGTTIMVPVDKVHELRLVLAGEGVPSRGQVGFEIFDQTDFRTTKFVQELNYRRALQGELARTINQFKEVKSSRVFIALPKESLFVEEKRPASAAIQLDLRSSLPPGKLAAIVHLVANAVEGLDPDQVTVADTKGRLIFKGKTQGENPAMLSSSQLEYQGKVENEIRENVQSMLEGIVGVGKAIVRVNASIDFNRVTLNEEEYDPSAGAIRSKRNIEESTETGEGATGNRENLLNQRAGVLPSSSGSQKAMTKKDISTNFEINKITRSILKPAGSIKRLSVAAVIDGTYKTENAQDGTVKRVYVPRTDEELKKFQEAVKRAMGYNEDREDQISVTSLPFSDTLTAEGGTEGEKAWDHSLSFLGAYKKTLMNFLLVGLVFLFVIRPLLKGLKTLPTKRILENKGELPGGSTELAQISPGKTKDHRDRILDLTQASPEKTAQLLKGWINERE